MHEGDGTAPNPAIQEEVVTAFLFLVIPALSILRNQVEQAPCIYKHFLMIHF